MSALRDVVVGALVVPAGLVSSLVVDPARSACSCVRFVVYGDRRLWIDDVSEWFWDRAMGVAPEWRRGGAKDRIYRS